MNKITKQCVAAVASLAMAGTLCVAGAVVAGSSAWADTPERAPWDLGNTAAQKKGTITITKYKYALKADGSQEKKDKVAGAEFTVKKVTKINNQDIDLTKYDDWMKVAGIVEKVNSGKESEANLTLENPGTKKETGSGETGTVKGEAKFPNLEIGLYKVEETKAAPGYAVLSKPFFMTIPQVTREKNSTDNTYTYNVSVEPKNKSTKDAIQKKVDTSGTVGAGDEIPYTITTDVTTTSETSPENYTKEDLQGFAVWDDALTNAYDGVTGDLTTENAKALVKEVKIGDTKIDTANYTVSVEKHSANNANGPENGRVRIKVTFIDGGLDDIAAAIKTAYKTDKTKLPKVSVKLVFKLAANAPTDNTGFYNKYGYQPGHGKNGTTPDPVNPPNPDPDTKVTLVKFQIKKVDGTNVSKALPGAKFAVFAKEQDAKNCVADKTRSDANCKGNATKGYTTGTTVAAGLAGATAGTAQDTGLTGAFEVKVGEKFYIVETAAPEGFALSPKVEEVTANNTGEGYDTNKAIFTYTFKDLPNGGEGNKRWFNLPETGAAGVIIFALIGLGLVGSGMFVFLKNRKKEEEQAA
ncbi:SpaH/EbpB family LPXTG-anchored major pilin [Bifidobacterium sp. UMB6791A]|nr:SpaH/EbpB family LPXTG-anchored major pilin [Bifidobacterium sp. UMB6791B]MDK8249162.1 SpaH/EbpB family LPXTG-anchored major pilin [Bifidobacterium sp. UMB6794B]MDK8635148.1 SpaH/EbpB family LPXTG-anchored major pilin [Bifidobacterium sp. UMB6791A]